MVFRDLQRPAVVGATVAQEVGAGVADVCQNGGLETA
jgi:hypothetical protein